MAPPQRYRRGSVLVATNGLQTRVTSVVEQLGDVWDQVGFNDEQRGERIKKLYEVIYKVLDEMVTEETDMLDKMTVKLDMYRRQLTTICQQLSIPTPEHIEQSKEYMLDKEKLVREEIGRLQDVKNGRLHTRDTLIEQDHRLCAVLDLPIHNFPHAANDDYVPADADMGAMRAHLTRLEGVLAARTDEYNRLRPVLCHLLTKLRREPKDQLERDVQSGAHIGEVANIASHLTENDLAHVSGRVRDMQREYDEYKQAIIEQVDVEWDSLCYWWDKVQAPDSERARVKRAQPDTFDPAILDTYRTLITELQELHARRAIIYDTYETWHKLWQEHVTYDEHRNDPKRFNTRGGNLQKELTREKKLESHLLPQARMAMDDVCKEWRERHPEDAVVLIAGRQPIDAIDGIIEQYGIDMEKAKKERMTARNADRGGTGVTARMHSPGHIRPRGATPVRIASRLNTRSPSPARIGVKPSTPSRKPIGGGTLGKPPTPRGRGQVYVPFNALAPSTSATSTTSSGLPLMESNRRPPAMPYVGLPRRDEKNTSIESYTAFTEQLRTPTNTKHNDLSSTRADENAMPSRR